MINRPECGTHWISAEGLVIEVSGSHDFFGDMRIDFFILDSKPKWSASYYIEMFYVHFQRLNGP